MQSSRVVLQRHLRTYGANANISAAVGRLRQIVAELKHHKDHARILGFEGEAAHHYFGVFDQLITAPTGFVFEARSRRPPKDPVNAMLSFMYGFGIEVIGVSIPLLSTLQIPLKNMICAVS